MKLLFDQNISFRITKLLADIFPACKHVSECGLMNCGDTDIWEYARKNNYSIVTFDADFYDISLIYGHPPKIIWMRTGNLTTREIAGLIRQNIDFIKVFLGESEYEDISCIEIS